MATEVRAGALTREEYNYRAFARSTSANMLGQFKASVRVGEAAPEFALAALDGSTVRLADLRGRYAVLEFGSIT